MVVWWVFFLVVKVSDKEIYCLLYFSVLQRKFSVELSLSMIRRFCIWLVRKVMSLPLIFYMLVTYLFSVGQIISLLEIWVFFLKYMEIFRVNILIILRVVFSPWIILQDFSPKFNVLFLEVIIVYLLLI